MPAHASLDKQILSLALPALGALIAEPLFVLIDSSMVGHLGATSLAGLSLASSILTTAVGLFVFLAYSTTATTARLFGAGRRREGLRAGMDGMWLALLIGFGAFILLWVCAPGIAGLMGARGDVGAAAIAYLRASAPGLPGMLVVYAATGTLRGLLDTKTPFIVASVGAGVNVALNAALIYGAHMGIAGSGLGTAVTQTLMGLALALPVIRAARAQGLGWVPRLGGLRASLGTGTPLLIRTISLRAALLLTVWAATALGKTPLAAHQVVNSLWTFAAFALDALAIACQALIGTALGAQDAHRGEQGGVESQHPESGRPGHPRNPERVDAAGPSPEVGGTDVDAVLRRSLLWGLSAGLVIGLVLASASPLLPHLFSSDPHVVAQAWPCLLVAASAMPLAGAVYLFDGVLMGAGDGKFLAWAGMGTLAVYAPFALVIGACAGHWAGSGTGLTLLWAAFAWIFMGARALSTGLRAKSPAWRR